MSATLHDRIERTFTEQLSEFDSRAKEQEDNAALLKDIHAAITALMAESGERGDDIREILQKRYNGGKLRLETYQLVRNVLDRVVIESMATMPDALDDDVFSRTTVIESGKPDDDRSQDRLQVGSVLRDRFLLQERVAGGSMGVVYKALDRRIAEAEGVDPWVAIKVLSPKLSRNAHALRALQQEAAKGRCLSHPHIVRFIDLDRDDDIYFIVMEWLEGRSLAAILDDDRQRDLDLATALDIVRQVGLALDYAHRCGVVHADVKPANIMISPSGEVKLFDFGIARIKQKQKPQGREDFDPGVLGAVTPAYSSMQVLTGEDPQPTDDVFSLGCLMYRLVAGHRVFGPRNAAEAAEQGMEPQRPHGLTDNQWRALKKALAYSRVSRFATPAAFLEALESEESAPPPLHHDEPIRVEPKPRAPEARRPWGVLALLLVIVAATAVLVTQPELRNELMAFAQSTLGRGQELADNADERPDGEAVDADASADPGTEPDAEPAAEDTTPAAEDTTPAAQDTAPAAQDTAPAPLGPATEEPAGAAQPGAGARQQAPQTPAGEDRVAADLPAATNLPSPAGERPGATEEGTADVPGGNDTTFALPAPGTEATHAATAAAAPAVTVPLAIRGPRAELDLVLREDGDPAVVELVRDSGSREPLSVLIEEVGFSGNRSPLTTGRYRISDPVAHFDAGQTTARFTISMSSDSVREADRQATLLLRNAENSASRLAFLNLVLEDDDQRAFEASLPPDTLGFAEAQVYVSERSPAAQVDVLRFNPGDAELEARYTISGGSATEGEDFFMPGAMGLVFGPGQRSARLLIPIVQDSQGEGEETFTLELTTLPSGPLSNVHRRITVVIGDDDAS